MNNCAFLTAGEGGGMFAFLRRIWTMSSYSCDTSPENDESDAALQ
jgi:hypothetical protein